MTDTNSPVDQGPILTLRTAPLWRRLAAMLYDAFLVLAISMGYGFSTLLIHNLTLGTEQNDFHPTIGGLIFQLGWLTSIIIFYCYFWRKAGQTVGMRAWRLKIVNQDNTQPPVYSRAFVRCIFALISMLSLGAGYLWSLVDKNGLSLHDRLSKTRVVVLPKAVKQGS